MHTANNLLVFQKTYPDLDVLGCEKTHPCEVVGIVAKARFGEQVRRFEGLAAVIFLNTTGNVLSRQQKA